MCSMRSSCSVLTRGTVAAVAAHVIEQEPEQDVATERLSKLLLVAEILAQCAAIWAVIDMTVGTEDLRYRLRWHFDRKRAKFERWLQRERSFAALWPATLLEAHTILEESGHGRS